MQGPQISFQERRIPELYNVIVGSICLVALVIMLVWILDRQIRSMRMGKQWYARLLDMPARLVSFRLARALYSLPNLPFEAAWSHPSMSESLGWSLP